MIFVAIFLLNAALSFALSLVVAHLVGPESFGRYAVALSISVVINTTVFEWLRLSTTRFYSERVRADQPECRGDPHVRLCRDVGRCPDERRSPSDRRP
jgi:hypothetical protein